MYTTNDFMNDCKLFNTIAGKDGKPTKQALYEQLVLINEELQETIRDLSKNDYTGVLDGYTDMMVTVAGFGQMLDALGMKTTEALQATASNNLTKFVPEYQGDVLIDTLALYQEKNIPIIYERSPKHNLVVFKDMQNKVRKPSNFVSNDLTEFVPVNLEIKEE